MEPQGTILVGREEPWGRGGGKEWRVQHVPSIMVTQGSVCHILHDSNGDLDEGEHQRSQGGVTHFSKHMAPEREAVEKLPIGHWLGCLLQREGQGRGQRRPSPDLQCETLLLEEMALRRCTASWRM